jgi:hypothetical protein
MTCEQSNKGIEGYRYNKLTSNLAFDHLGISTIIFRIVCWSFAYNGTSWNADTGTPSFSM